MTPNLDSITQVIDYQTSRTVRVDSAQCLPRRHRRSGCKRCMEVCPTGAISIGDALKIDTDMCLECGVCASVCPTGALEGQAPTNVELVNRLAEAGANGAQVFVACEAYKIPGWDPANVVRVHCLGRVDDSVLVAAVAQGVHRIALVDGPCGECQHSARHEVAVDSVARVQRLLGLFGVDAQLGFRPSVPSFLEGAAPVSTGGSGLSRRGFLKMLVGQTARASQATINQVIANPFGIVQENKPVVRGQLPFRVPVRRQLVLQAMKRLGQPQRAEAELDDGAWARYGLTGSCDGCQMCAFFCPTGAVRKVAGDTIALDFQASTCLNCRLCLELCFRHGVTLQPAVALSAVLNETVERIPLEDRITRQPSLRGDMHRLFGNRDKKM